MAEQRDSRTETLLLRHLAADLREHVIGVAADQSYRSDHNNQNDCEHHRVFGDVLATLFLPKLTHCFNHFSPNPINDRPRRYTTTKTVHRRMEVKVS
jgi:hypothetical protein